MLMKNLGDGTYSPPHPPVKTLLGLLPCELCRSVSVDSLSGILRVTTFPQEEVPFTFRFPQGRESQSHFTGYISILANEKRYLSHLNSWKTGPVWLGGTFLSCWHGRRAGMAPFLPLKIPQCISVRASPAASAHPVTVVHHWVLHLPTCYSHSCFLPMGTFYWLKPKLFNTEKKILGKMFLKCTPLGDKIKFMRFCHSSLKGDNAHTPSTLLLQSASEKSSHWVSL